MVKDIKDMNFLLFTLLLAQHNSTFQLPVYIIWSFRNTGTSYSLDPLSYFIFSSIIIFSQQLQNTLSTIIIFTAIK